MRHLTGNVITFDKIYAPGGIQLKDAVIISPCALLMRIHAIHVAVPTADACSLRDLSCRLVRPQNRRILMNGLTGNAAHNVNAKLKPQRMYVFCQRCKALAAGRGWKAIRCRDQSGILIHAKLRKRAILMARRSRLIPLNVDNNILPAILFQMLCHEPGILSYNLLRYGCSVTIPAVPPHGCFDHFSVHVLSPLCL